VEVVMGEVTREELIALLLKVEGNRPDSLGICSQWYRNPEGPQAADTITALQAELAEARARIAVLEGALGALITETDGLNYACNQLDGPAIIAARQALAGKETP
jgi:hypothetical protein